MTKVGFILFGWLLALLTKPFSDAIVWFFRGPRLKLEFDGKKDECRIRTPVEREFPNASQGEAYFTRVKVTNDRAWRIWSIRSIRQCRGYLVNVERKNPQTGKFESASYCDSIPLNWSYISGDASHTGIEIHDGVTQYLNVVATYSNRPDFVPETPTLPFRYQLLFDPAASMPQGEVNRFALRLTIRVRAEEVSPEEIRVVVEWHGNWNDFRAYRSE